MKKRKADPVDPHPHLTRLRGLVCDVLLTPFYRSFAPEDGDRFLVMSADGAVSAIVSETGADPAKVREAIERLKGSLLR